MTPCRNSCGSNISCGKRSLRYQMRIKTGIVLRIKTGNAKMAFGLKLTGSSLIIHAMMTCCHFGVKQSKQQRIVHMTHVLDDLTLKFFNIISSCIYTWFFIVIVCYIFLYLRNCLHLYFCHFQIIFSSLFWINQCSERLYKTSPNICCKVSSI